MVGEQMSWDVVLQERRHDITQGLSRILRAGRGGVYRKIRPELPSQAISSLAHSWSGMFGQAYFTGQAKVSKVQRFSPPLAWTPFPLLSFLEVWRQLLALPGEENAVMVASQVVCRFILRLLGRLGKVQS